MTRLSSPERTEAGILSRFVRPDADDLPATAARAILKFDIDPWDRERMHELALKNQEGALSDSEKAELEVYRILGLFLDLIRAKARLSLKGRSARR